MCVYVCVCVRAHRVTEEGRVALAPEEAEEIVDQREDQVSKELQEKK